MSVIVCCVPLIGWNWLLWDRCEVRLERTKLERRVQCWETSLLTNRSIIRPWLWWLCWWMWWMHHSYRRFYWRLWQWFSSGTCWTPEWSIRSTTLLKHSHIKMLSLMEVMFSGPTGRSHWLVQLWMLWLQCHSSAEWIREKIKMMLNSHLMHKSWLVLCSWVSCTALLPFVNRTVSCLPRFSLTGSVPPTQAWEYSLSG